MRTLALITCLLVAARTEAQEDDPKLARAAERKAGSLALALPDEDDPKLARGLVLRRSWQDLHGVPRVKLAYRRLTTAGLQNDTIDFNAVELDYYPSSAYFRFGLQTTLGFGANPYSSWLFTVGATMGLQVPWRVTPFVEGRFAAGLIGATFMGQNAISYIYAGGVEGGVELYLAGRFYLTASMGWAHPVFSGIDVASVRANPLLNPQRKDFAADTLTFKVGLGL